MFAHSEKEINSLGKTDDAVTTDASAFQRASAKISQRANRQQVAQSFSSAVHLKKYILKGAVVTFRNDNGVGKYDSILWILWIQLFSTGF